MPGNPPTGIITRQQWATSLLMALGNNSPSPATVSFVVGWATEEGGATNNSCRYNFLNTTQPYNGSTNCTAIGVQSYNSVNDSIAATAMTLKNGNYPSLLNALATNDERNLGMVAGVPMAGNVAGDLTVWVHGSRSPIATGYIQGILSAAGNGNNAVVSVQDQNPDNSQAQGIANTLGNTTLNPMTLAKGVIGFIMMLVGLALLVKALTPQGVQQAIGKAAKGALLA
jgi:hypothetical protein